MITVHHLDFSRSTRVLWLLEELGVPYELVRYGRKAGGPAPKELSLVHPLGKSPAIVDGDLILGESSAILRYLDRNYGDQRFTPSDPKKAAAHDEWIDFVEGSAALPVLMTLIGRGTGGLPEALASFSNAELSKMFNHVSTAVANEGPYLMGPQLTLADIQMSYILSISSATGLLKEYPNLDLYLDMLNERPALARAIERGGPMTPSGR